MNLCNILPLNIFVEVQYSIHTLMPSVLHPEKLQGLEETGDILGNKFKPNLLSSR